MDLEITEKMNNITIIDDTSMEVEQPIDDTSAEVEQPIDDTSTEVEQPIEQPPEPIEPPSGFVMPPPIEEQLAKMDQEDEAYEKRLKAENEQTQMINNMKQRVRVISLLKMDKSPFTDIRYISTIEQKKLLKIMNSYSDTPFSTICEEFNEQMCDILNDSHTKYENMPCYDNTLRTTEPNNDIIYSVEPLIS
jgi:hypothetical protein